MVERRTYGDREVSISLPRPPADDWFDLYDVISQGEAENDRDLMLSDLSDNEKLYYRRTRLKAYNAIHVFGTDYKCGKDKEGKERYLYEEVREMLLSKATLILRISRPKAGRILVAGINYPRNRESLEKEEA